MSIQESFNQIIGAYGNLGKMALDIGLTAATGGVGAGALIKDIAGDGAAKAAKPLTEYQKENLALRREQLDLAKSKAEVGAAKEARLQEDLLDKQQRTGGLVAQRKATAEYEKAQAGMVKAQAAAIKEKTAGQALKRKKAEYAFKQQRASEKAGHEAIGNYMSNVEALNGQKIGMKQRKEMLQDAQQIQLEI